MLQSWLSLTGAATDNELPLGDAPRPPTLSPLLHYYTSCSNLCAHYFRRGALGHHQHIIYKIQVSVETILALDVILKTLLQVSNLSFSNQNYTYSERTKLEILSMLLSIYSFFLQLYVSRVLNITHQISIHNITVLKWELLLIGHGNKGEKHYLDDSFGGRRGC